MKKTLLTQNTEDNACAAMRPLLSQFIDGGLPSEASWAVQKHIALCTSCAQCARDLQKTAALLAALPVRPLPAGFDATLNARIAAASAQRAQINKSPWRRWAARLAAEHVAAPLFGNPAQRAGLSAAFAAFVIVTGFALNQTLTPTIIRVPAPATSSDKALVATCLTQQHATVANEPLSDPSAQMLDGLLDTDPATAAPTTASQPQGLSDADAVALVNETD